MKKQIITYDEFIDEKMEGYQTLTKKQLLDELRVVESESIWDEEGAMYDLEADGRYLKGYNDDEVDGKQVELMI